MQPPKIVDVISRWLLDHVRLYFQTTSNQRPLVNNDHLFFHTQSTKKPLNNHNFGLVVVLRFGCTLIFLEQYAKTYQTQALSMILTFQGVVRVLTYSDANCSTLARTRIFQNDPNLCQQCGPFFCKGQCRNRQLHISVYVNSICAGLIKSKIELIGNIQICLLEFCIVKLKVIKKVKNIVKVHLPVVVLHIVRETYNL